MSFEYILLKKLIVNGEYFGKVIPLLEPQYFDEVGNQELFKLIKHHYTTYAQIPTTTELLASIKNVPNDAVRTQITKDLGTIASTEEVTNLQFMLDETVNFVKDAIYYESLMIGSEALQEKSEAKKLKAKELMEKMSKVSIDTDLGLAFADIETMIKYYQERLIGIKSYHDNFDKRLGPGFLPGTLSIIMAASGIGKSLLMTDLLSNMIKNGKNVLLVSMEMADRELMKRVHANALDLEINKLREISPDVIRQKHRESNCGQLYIKDYPPGSFSALMLDQLIDSYKVEKGVEFDIIMLDYLGIMKSDLLSPQAGLYSYVKSIVEEVRAIAVKRQMPVISASQLNRSAVNNRDASNDSVSDSIGTVQTADFIIFLLQDEQMKEEKRLTCKVTKNRFTGRTDTWDMIVDYEHMRFSDALDGEIGLDESTIKTILTENTLADLSIIEARDNANNTEDTPEEYDIMKELGLAQ